MILSHNESTPKCKNFEYGHVSHICLPLICKEKPLTSICKNSKKILCFTPFKIIGLLPAVQNLNPSWREAREKSSNPNKCLRFISRVFLFSYQAADIVCVGKHSPEETFHTHNLKGLSHVMDLAFEDMHGQF